MMKTAGKQWHREAVLAWLCVLAASIGGDVGAEVLKRSEAAPVRYRAEVVVVGADIAGCAAARSAICQIALQS
jgi:hypothetical protein